MNDPNIQITHRCWQTNPNEMKCLQFILLQPANFYECDDAAFKLSPSERNQWHHHTWNYSQWNTQTWCVIDGKHMLHGTWYIYHRSKGCKGNSYYNLISNNNLKTYMSVQLRYLHKSWTQGNLNEKANCCFPILDLTHKNFGKTSVKSCIQIKYQGVV